MFADPASGTAPEVAPPGTPTRVKDAGQDDTTVASEPPPVQLEAVRTDKVEKSVKGVLDTLTDAVNDSMCPLCALGNLLVSTGVAVKHTPVRELVAGGVVNEVLGPAAAGLGVVRMGAAAKRAGDEGDYETSARLWTSIAVTGVSLLAGGVAGPEGAVEGAAAEAGVEGGEVWNARNGIDFAKSDALYPAGEGQRAIVKIEYTGKRNLDYKAANEAAGLDSKPQDYTWHHLDDYDPATNTGTLQLVETATHRANGYHHGGVKQYEAARGVKYK